VTFLDIIFHKLSVIFLVFSNKNLTFIFRDLCKSIFWSPWTRFRISEHVDFIRCWNMFSMIRHIILWLLQRLLLLYLFYLFQARDLL